MIRDVEGASNQHCRGGGGEGGMRQFEEVLGSVPELLARIVAGQLEE